MPSYIGAHTTGSHLACLEPTVPVPPLTHLETEAWAQVWMEDL